ncbi:MAG: YhcH/YjgK/YiaL family protein [bacterium]
MIYDSSENFYKYININSAFADVYKFLNETNLTDIPLGKTNINNNGSFAIISEYNTKKTEDSFIEYHKKYIDIQIVISGSENIGFCFFDESKNIMFDEEKDFGKIKGELIYFSLKPENFAVFFPFEGHTPQLNINNNENFVKKIVFKVPFK